MNARAALFDLYGDHLRSRGGRASVAALVRLLAPLGIAAPAVRTAVSRTVRQGRLVPVRLPQGPGHEVTPRCVRRLDEAALRIYRAGTITWSGRWHVVGALPGDAADDRVFATRNMLLHGRRNFLFRDPGLPAELLPPGRPGEKARAYFEQEAGRLLPAAAFADRHLADP
ncbi:PaaX family transcriptional regulator C-terminal domain-containing protein [Streptosporangium fragile]|uniref:PaaX family transcriptional regulator C-terminal domain-containing protein n=1 Tax=Streptosporangium fragile TaxID=46186 RepID=UPI0031F15FA6